MALKMNTNALAQRQVQATRRVAAPLRAPRSTMVVRASAEPPSTPPTPAPEPVVITSPVPKTVSIGDAMAFSGPAPEIVNGRLAMLGFLAAVGAEVASGETVVSQLSDAPLPILLTFAAFAVASLVPILKGANKEAFGPLTPAAELLNGRAAMIGMAALLTIEAAKGSALF